MTQSRLGDDDGAGALTLGGVRRGMGRGWADGLSAGSPLSTAPAGGLTFSAVDAIEAQQRGGGGRAGDGGGPDGGGPGGRRTQIP
jgi:hypothetical protein